MHCGDLNGEEVKKKGDICICMMIHFAVQLETNTTIQSNYTPIKIILKRKKKETKTARTLGGKSGNTGIRFAWKGGWFLEGIHSVKCHKELK